MKKDSTVKTLCFVTIWIFIIASIFAISMVLQIYNSTIKNVIGKFWWSFLYVLLPMFILVIPLLVKYIAKCKERTILVYSFILIILYVSIIYTTHVVTYKYIQDFTTQKWLDFKYERILMLDDLKNKYNLVGMSIEDIKNLLGSPDVESDNEIEYVIDEGWIDPEMLVLRFENQIIIDFYTYTEFKPSD